MAQVGLLEDNARIANLFTLLLNHAGHQVTIYGHAQQCLQALLSEKPTNNSSCCLQMSPGTLSLPIEVLILDLSLPDIDGVEVLRYLQSHPDTQALPLIICTAAAGAEVTRALRVAPRAGLLGKPFKFQALVSAIDAALKPD
jgi:CheY-like chemotaxis protein